MDRLYDPGGREQTLIRQSNEDGQEYLLRVNTSIG